MSISYRYLHTIVILACLVSGFVRPARAGEIPYAELQALDRAIERELNRQELGSQTLGDLQRLRHRLGSGRSGGGGLSTDKVIALEPLQPMETSRNLERLQAEAADGNRSALRSLALYQLYQNQPELALETWRRMGKANQADVAFQLLSAYMELALGEYSSAGTHLEEASRLLATRTGLELSEPVFCTNIAGYRIYEKRTGSDLLPGEDTLLYVEVEGADFHAIPSGEVECRMMFGLTLRNEAGTVVWSEPNYGEYAPYWNGPIRDLHTALTWRVPVNLAGGLYTIQVEAVEDSSKRRGSSEHTFTVGTRATNPAPRPGDNLPPAYNKAIQDATKAFPGAPVPQLPPVLDGIMGGGSQESGLMRLDNRNFELLQQYYRDQRVEK